MLRATSRLWTSRLPLPTPRIVALRTFNSCSGLHKSQPSRPPAPLPFRTRSKDGQSDKGGITPSKARGLGAGMGSYFGNILDRAWSIAYMALTLLVVGHLVVTYVIALHWTRGASMLPTLSFSSSCVVISKLHRYGKGIKVGDLVSFSNPYRQPSMNIKRVIAMPGDFVLRDTPGAGEGMMIQVPPGHCYVEGDNLDWSRDSRYFGPLPLALIDGRVLGEIFPPTIFRSPYVPIDEPVAQEKTE